MNEFRKCAQCFWNGALVGMAIDIELYSDGHVVTVRQFPGYQCPECGNIVFSSEDLRKGEQKLTGTSFETITYEQLMSDEPMSA